MKKFLCLILTILLIVPFGTISLAYAADAGDVIMAEEDSSNNAFVDTTESTNRVTVTGKVTPGDTFTFKGADYDNVTLYQGDVMVQRAGIAADGTYTLTDVEDGTYTLVISISGWTTYTIVDLNISLTAVREGDGVLEIYYADEYMFAGDVDGSGTVNIEDIAALLTNYGEDATATTESSDVNHDTIIDMMDITFILNENNFAKTAMSRSAMINGGTGYY